MQYTASGTHAIHRNLCCGQPSSQQKLISKKITEKMVIKLKVKDKNSEKFENYVTHLAIKYLRNVDLFTVFVAMAPSVFSNPPVAPETNSKTQQ